MPLGTARRGRTHRAVAGNLLNVQQTVHAYSFDGTSYTPTGTVILTATATNGNEVSVLSGGSYTFKTVPPVDQPTFGILNPARRPGRRCAIVPRFRHVQRRRNRRRPRPVPGNRRDPAAGREEAAILEACKRWQTATASILWERRLPTSLPTNPIALPLSTSENPPTAPKTVVTSTGLINHNQGGDNALTRPHLPCPPAFIRRALSPGLIFGSPNAPYAFDLFDRSTLNLLCKNAPG